MQRLGTDGVQAVVEVGPGRVLCGFARATTPNISAYGGGELRRIRHAAGALAAADVPAALAA